MAAGVLLVTGALLTSFLLSPEAHETPSGSNISSLPATIAASSTLDSLTDAEVIALIEREVAERGVSLDTLRVRLTGDPRVAFIQYASTLDVNHPAFNAQTVLITLAVSRAVARSQPAPEGGVRVAAIPGSEGEVGLRLITLGWEELATWSRGKMSDQLFVRGWGVWSITRE